MSDYYVKACADTTRNEKTSVLYQNYFKDEKRNSNLLHSGSKWKCIRNNVTLRLNNLDKE